MKNGGLDMNLLDALSRRAEAFIDSFRREQVPPGGIFAAIKRDIHDYIDANYRGPIPGEVVKQVYNEILTAALSVVRPLKVVYMGPEGTYSNQATMEFFGATVESVPMRTISDVFHDVEAGKADFGVVPVENSNEGAVTYTLDELIETDLQIVAEKYTRISCSVLSKDGSLESVGKLYTHPQPLGQCKGWLRKNLPNAEICIVESTSRAAEIASVEKGAAAIGSSAAAGIYGLNVLADHVEDSRQNYTRFFIIGRDRTKPTGKDKTSIVFSIKDRPGALFDVLSHFKNTGINMTKIESRPDKKKMWEYNFFIDFMGHREDTKVGEVLVKIKSDAIFLKVLGSYPVAN
ncbi:MAG TPA: prephenate dehydratase [Spirochaetota bacterium]|nr:prephenate dehydratase [Spirochaetota bacterium]HRZ26599.1 prephenate dehydratase [Spirochaetota bacterium]HSA14188.1 prephenate dehydratase [Spirochaetota bacterium]